MTDSPASKQLTMKNSYFLLCDILFYLMTTGIVYTLL